MGAPWFRDPPPGPAPLLFCFPHAGGSIGPYARWRGRLADEIVPVTLPGRDHRRAEGVTTDPGALIEALVEAVGPYTQRPYALFGHSMGATVAYELSRALKDEGLPPPRALVVASRRCPSAWEPEPSLTAQGDAGFVAGLEARWGPLPEAIRQDPEALALFVPVLRGDIGLLERYRPDPRRIPLRVPIVAVGGEEDPRVPLASLEGWAAETVGPFVVQRFSGGHFFFGADPGPITAFLAATLPGLSKG